MSINRHVALVSAGGARGEKSVARLPEQRVAVGWVDGGPVAGISWCAVRSAAQAVHLPGQCQTRGMAAPAGGRHANCLSSSGRSGRQAPAAWRTTRSGLAGVAPSHVLGDGARCSSPRSVWPIATRPICCPATSGRDHAPQSSRPRSKPMPTSPASIEDRHRRRRPPGFRLQKENKPLSFRHQIEMESDESRTNKSTNTSLGCYMAES